jgi:hypothetical protein
MVERRSVAAFAFALLLILSSISAIIAPPESVDSLDPSTSKSSSPSYIGTFGNGVSSIDLHPSLNESTSFPHMPGMRVSDIELNLSASPERAWDNDTILMSALTSTSTFNQTTVGFNGHLRLNTSGTSGAILNVGTNNTVISGHVSMSGNHSYDVLHLLCGIVSCGHIVATGPLKITANVIKIDLGNSITANHMTWGNTGQGTATSGANGAGGAGHGGTGGAGGGSGGTAGSSYGNGSEAGSSGGNSSGGSSTAHGGRGGGEIELIAGMIYLNGTLAANGHGGDGGPGPPNGRGNGLGGAGGGSGGSISMLANTVYVGSSATLSASGGDGGDGSDGMCPPGQPCLFLYHGGDGGGGGGGGVVRITTMPGQLTNNAGTTVTGGSGGQGGAPYGTGSYGTGGSSGNSGVTPISISIGTGAPSYNLSGTFLSPPVGESGTLHLDAMMNLTYVQPANTSIEAAYRYTVDSTTWSDWQPFNISGESLAPFALIQFQLNLSTTDNSTTPTVQSIAFSLFTWSALEDTALDIGMVQGGNEFWSFDAPLGLIASGRALATMGPTQVLLPFPGGASPADAGWVHIMPPGFLQDNDVTFSIGGHVIKTLNSSDYPEHGLTLRLPASLLASVWPSSTSGQNGTGGVTWEDVTLSCAVGIPFMGSFGVSLVAIPYHLTIDVGANGSLLSSLNHHVNVTSNHWLEADFNDFPIISDGDGPDGQSFTLRDLNVTYIDDLIPVVTESIFLVNGQEVTDARIGDLVEIQVRVQGDEDDLMVNWHIEGLGSISSWPPTALDAMVWDALEGAYIGQFDTSQLPPDYGERMALWLWVNDTSGNNLSPTGVGDWVADITLRPQVPELATGVLTGCEQVTDSVCEVGPGAEIHFEATAASSRSNLDVFVHLVRGGTEDMVVPLHWDASNNVYRGDLSLFTSDIGIWAMSWRALDVGRSDDSFSSHSITHVKVIDNHSSSEVSFSVTSPSPESDSLDLRAEWSHSGYDTGQARVGFSGPEGFSDLVFLSNGNRNDSVTIDSYVALGSGAVEGDGASHINLSSTSLIHQALQNEWPNVQLTNLGHGWATVQTFNNDLNQIRAANPDLVTIFPTDDYASSSTSTWESNYPNLLDELGGMGAEVYIGALMIDPDYVCHIGSGPGGCHSFGEFESVRAKNRILIELASTRPWVTIVPMSDDGPLNEDWLNDDDEFTDAGHSALAEAFLHSIEGQLSLRTIIQEASLSIDISEWLFGDYQFELIVVDSQDEQAEDILDGADASFTLVPADEVLSISILTPSPENLHPGEFEIAFDAVCTIGCEMILEVELDGEQVDMFHPIQGIDNLTLTNLTVGQHQLGLKLWTQDWPLAVQWAILDFEVTPTPVPVWSVLCTTGETERVLTGVARDDELGNLTYSTHSVDCRISNSGNAAGMVQISSESVITPFICSDAQQTIEAGSHAEFSCTADESDENAGSHPVSLVFEQVDAEGDAGTWQSTLNLSAPGFEVGIQEVEKIDDGSSSSPGAAGQSSLTWVLVILAVLAIGIALVTTLFVIRGKAEEGQFEEEQFEEEQSEPIPSGESAIETDVGGEGEGTETELTSTDDDSNYTVDENGVMWWVDDTGEWWHRSSDVDDWTKHA